MPSEEGKERKTNNTVENESKDLFTDFDGMEAIFRTRAITLKIERDKNKDL